MSRRTIALLIVFFAALVIANIIVLLVWLPRAKTAGAKTAPANATAAAPAVTGSSQVAPAPPNGVGAGFAVERQVASASGNLQIKYLRDRKTKMRAIAVDDARRPNGGTVLFQSKHSAWALVSPDDQWILVQERSPSGKGNVQLYHRSNDSSAQYALAQESGGPSLQDTVWNAYLTATQADANTPRQGVTIDATAWEDDSRKLDFSVIYLAGPNNPEVPAPWSCTYDVSSKQVQPISAPVADQPDQETAGADQRQGSAEVASNNPFADNASESQSSNVEEEELPGEKFPATRLDELTVPDVNESSLEEINYAINEMYARHGAEFKDKKVANQFAEFSWYKPQPGLTLQQAEGEFSDVEKQNLKVLKQCRDAKLAAARRKSSPTRGQRAQEESTGEKVFRGIRAWQDAGAPMPPHP